MNVLCHDMSALRSLVLGLYVSLVLGTEIVKIGVHFVELHQLHPDHKFQGRKLCIIVKCVILRYFVAFRVVLIIEFWQI